MTTPAPNKLTQAIKRIVTDCLRVKPEEEVAIITDEVYLKAAVILRRECSAITNQVHFFILEDLTPRPVKRIPFAIIKALRSADVSVLWVAKYKGEIATFRSPLLQVASENPRLRHAHMPGVATATIIEAFSKDLSEMQQLTRRVYQIVSQASHAHVGTKAGSDFELQFSPTYQWVAEDNIIEPGYWSCLPGGEVYTHPASLSGHIVVDGILGDVFSDIFGVLKPKDYLHLDIKDSFVTRARCQNKKLLSMFNESIRSEKNANRIGEFSLGTNINLSKLNNDFLRDGKIPSVHVAFGDGYPEKTGCPYYCSHHLDATLREATVVIDGRLIMRSGHYV